MESAPLRFGLDLDGVAYRWSDTARLLIRYYHGIKVGESQYWNYIQDHVPGHVWKWLWEEGVTKHGLFRHGNCFPETFEAVNELADSGWDIVVITSRPASALVDTLGWLAYHQLPAREVHVLGEGARKSAVPCDLYLDDAPKNVLDTMSVGRSLLWTRPWNTGDWDALNDVSQYAPRVTRVKSWREVLKIADEMKKEKQ